MAARRAASPRAEAAVSVPGQPTVALSLLTSSRSRRPAQKHQGEQVSQQIRVQGLNGRWTPWRECERSEFDHWTATPVERIEVRALFLAKQ